MARLDRDTFVIGLDLYTLLQSGHNEIVIKDNNGKTWTIPDVECFNFSPNIIENKTNIFLKPDEFPQEVGSYDFNFALDEMGGHDVLPFRIILNISDSTPSQDDFEEGEEGEGGEGDEEGEGGEGDEGIETINQINYKLKYNIEWHGEDLKHDNYKLELLYKDFEGGIKELNGYADLERPQVNDLLDCIRGTSAVITLHANKNLSLNELYFEEEKSVQAKFYRNDKIIFIGFVKPDGVGQSFVQDHWEIQLDAIDSLGTLKDLAFVSPTKQKYDGKISQIEAVYAILRRTGLDLPINVRIKKYNNKMSVGDCPLMHTKVNATQYYKDDNSTLMDCEGVLNSILEPYGAVVVQYNAEWFVFSPIDIVSGDNEFHRFEKGEFQEVTTYDLGAKIESYPTIMDFYHINKNQWINMAGSLGAFRVNYKYGEVDSLFENPNFKPSNGEIKGWELDNVVIGDNRLWIQKENGIRIANQTKSILKEGLNISIDFDFEGTDRTTGFHAIIKVGDYYLNGNEWVLEDDARVLVDNYREVNGTRISNGRKKITISPNPIPTDGVLSINVFKIQRSERNPNRPVAVNGHMYFYEIRAYLGTRTRVNSESHTIQKVGESTLVKANKTVYNGDNQTDAYLGTLYDLNGEPTIYWKRESGRYKAELLRLMVEDYVILNARPAQVFHGDVRGFFPYLSIYNIANLNGEFMPLSFLFKTKQNITEITGKQIYKNVDVDYIYTKSYDIKKAEKPTIN